MPEEEWLVIGDTWLKGEKTPFADLPEAVKQWALNPENGITEPMNQRWLKQKVTRADFVDRHYPTLTTFKVHLREAADGGTTTSAEPVQLHLVPHAPEETRYYVGQDPETKAILWIGFTEGGPDAEG